MSGRRTCTACKKKTKLLYFSIIGGTSEGGLVFCEVCDDCKRECRAKQCTGPCEKFKPLSDFYATGNRSHCKKCQSQANRSYRKSEDEAELSKKQKQAMRDLKIAARAETLKAAQDMATEMGISLVSKRRNNSLMADDTYTPPVYVRRV